jgi:hypothetical protein
VKEIPPAIQLLKNALADHKASPAVQRAATDYARWCREAEQRLEQVASMLSKGSDYQALQVSEQEPALLDLVAALSFGSEKAWQDLCEANHLPVPPLLDAKTVQSLEALYARGLTANHPLYKDLRAAALSRDDAKALQIVRTILKLNPTDANARAELLRLENKHFQETLEDLRNALKSDDEDLISSLTETLSNAASEEKLQRLDPYQQGQAIRRAYRRRQALDKLPDMIQEMQSHQTAQDWEAVGTLLEQTDALIEANQIHPDDETWVADLRAVRSYFEHEQSADSKRREFERCLKRFELFATEIETRLMTGSGVTFAEIAEKDESFVRLWKELEGFQMPVAPDQLQRLRAAGQELRAKLERMQRAKKLRTLAAAAAVLVFLGALAGTGFHAWKAYALTGELGAYQQTGKCLPAEELILKLRSDGALLTKWPYLQAKIEEVDGWTRQARTLEQQTSAALDLLETSFKDGTSRLPAAQLARQVDDAVALVRQLPADLEPEPGNRLAAVQTRTELHLAELLKQQTSLTRDALTQLEKAAADELSYEVASTQSTESVASIRARLEPLEASLKPETELLRLPADLETRIHGLRQKVNTFQTALDTLNRVRAETASAETLENYQQALVAWQDLPFAETAPALSLFEKLPTESAFLAALLTGGDELVLKAILDDVSGPHMIPEAPMDRDLKMLLDLREDENLNNVWEHVLTDYARRRGDTTFWSLGPLTKSDLGESSIWKGRCYDPAVSELSVSFPEREFRKASINGSTMGQSVSGSRLSAASDLMNSLQLNRMTDPNGERFMRSLLDVLDHVVKQEKGSPIAKAYVMLRLEEMAQPRAFAWGFHFSRALQADLRDLHSLTATTPLRSEDWLLPQTQARLGKSLAAFFLRCRDRYYLKEASARRELLSLAAKAGLRFGGYVEVDQRLILTNAGRAAQELWVIGLDTGKPVRIPAPPSNQEASADTQSSAVQTGVRPLSPVFFLPVDRKQLLERFESAMSSTGAEIQPLPGEALFITPP